MANNVQLACFIDPNFGENAYVVWHRDAGPCWIIDPGLPPSAKQIIQHVVAKKLKPDALLLTHGHADHIAGIPEVLDALGPLPVWIAAEENSSLIDPRANLSAGMGVPFAPNVKDTHDLAPGTQLTLDDTTWHVLDVSGHSPGGRALYCAAAGLVIVGDALFDGSIGRTDFPTSNHDTLIRNIKQNLFALPDETQVYSGHGPVTTIGQERRFNPFLH